MAPEEKEWKSLSIQGNRGGHLYLSKTDLKRLQRDGDLDLDEDIEYKVSVGVSDGRARAFVQLRNSEG